MKRFLILLIPLLIVTYPSYTQVKEYIPIDPRLTQPQDMMLNVQAEVALDLVNEVLIKVPPQHPEPLERTLALYLLDALLHEVYAPQRMPVQEFLQKRIENMAVELENIKVKEGAFIWKLYSHSFVVRTREVTVGFDLIRPAIRFENFYTDTKAEMERIIRQCDILFVSHEHTDHADEWVALQFIAQGKPVVVPPGVFKDQPFYGKLLIPDRDPKKLHNLSYQDGKKALKVVIYPGHQANHDMYNNVPVIYTPDGLCISHTGDQNIRDNNPQDTVWIHDIKNHHKVDVLMYGVYMPHPLIKGFDPKLVIAGHENEMGHGIHSRFPYWRVHDRLKTLPYPYVILTWGEKYHYFTR